MADQNKKLAELTGKIFDDPSVSNIIYGEAGHADNRFFRQVMSEENMDSLARANVRDVRIEIPHVLQPFVEEFVSGKSDRTQFVSAFNQRMRFFELDANDALERIELIADGIERAKARNMKIKFVDQLDAVSDIQEIRGSEGMKRLQACTIDRTRALSESELRDARQLTRITIDCANEDPEMKRVLTKAWEKRSAGDAALGHAAAMENPNGRTAFFYGNAHSPGIAQGHPGKSIGVAGVFDTNTEAVRELLPFYFFHFNIETGGVGKPPILDQILNRAPAPLKAPELIF